VPPFAGEFEARFGVRVISTYGLTDCGMPTVFSQSDPGSKLGSAGRARDGWRVRVVDEGDFDVPAGESGEIVIRCERPWGNASGYYKNAEATVAAWRNGWFHTGDLGRLDEDGFLWHVGRNKDAIRRRGENISAFEVEQAIVKHPAVAEAAAFPLPSELGEEEVAVAVVLKSGETLDEIELVEHCKKAMPYYMVPRYIQFASDLPRNLSLKVQKFKLKQLALENFKALWDREKSSVVVKR
jgi:crotonobetaine/carnitine-CoA ligase